MTEEVVVDKVAPVVEDKSELDSQPSVPELTPVEQQAQEQGWVPLEDWKAEGRPAEEWRPAKEFVDRGELYKSIHTTKRELKQTQAALTALQRHHQYVFEKAHQQAIRDLRAEKRLAIRNDDIDRLEEIETELETLQDTHVQEKAALAQAQAAAQQVVVPEFDAFTARNPWYVSDKDMRNEADAIGFVHINNGGSKETLFAKVESEMRRKFPEKFGVKRAAPNAVAGVDRTGKKANKADTIDLSPEERKIMMTFVNNGVMSEADYIKELKKVGR